jgi:uncharacterized membrane protein YeaQ/YmgE (transglycosylase-associated protein family)
MGLLLIGLIVLVVALVLGVVVIGLVFKLLWFVLAGLVIGALARLVLPGEQRIGVLMTALCGIGGSVLGGVIAHLLGLGTILGFVVAVAVAAALVSLVERRRPRGIV